MSSNVVKRRTRSSYHHRTERNGAKRDECKDEPPQPTGYDNEGADTAAGASQSVSHNKGEGNASGSSSDQDKCPALSSVYDASRSSSPSTCSSNGSIGSAPASPPLTSALNGKASGQGAIRTSRRIRKRKRLYDEEREDRVPKFMHGDAVKAQAQLESEVEEQVIASDDDVAVEVQHFSNGCSLSSVGSIGVCSNKTKCMSKALPVPQQLLPPLTAAAAAVRTPSTAFVPPAFAPPGHSTIKTSTAGSSGSVPVCVGHTHANAHNPLMGMANAAELLRTSSPELQPITINAVNALLSVSPKTEPAPSPINGLGALASLASLEDLTPKSRREAIQRLQEKSDASAIGRMARRSRRSVSGVTSSRRERARERERAGARHSIVDRRGCDDNHADNLELLPQYACPEYNKHGRIGMYSPRERKMMLERWNRKRRNRVWRKVVRYGCRKNLANGRVRIKGRFVKSTPENAAIATSS